jgi:tRNA-splicing endonuclease subunit Sen34
MSQTRIPIHIANKCAFVWDVEGISQNNFQAHWLMIQHLDLAKLRSQHHICGILVGTLPHLSQQNVFLGVPLVLMPEEVVLLVEKGLSSHAQSPVPIIYLTIALRNCRPCE